MTSVIVQYYGILDIALDRVYWDACSRVSASKNVNIQNWADLPTVHREPVRLVVRLLDSSDVLQGVAHGDVSRDVGFQAERDRCGLLVAIIGPQSDAARVMARNWIKALGTQHEVWVEAPTDQAELGRHIEEAVSRMCDVHSLNVQAAMSGMTSGSFMEEELPGSERDTRPSEVLRFGPRP